MLLITYVIDRVKPLDRRFHELCGIEYNRRCMQTLHDVPTLRGQPPPGYGEVLYWRVTEKLSRVLLINLLSIPLFILWGIFFFWLARTVGQMYAEDTGARQLNLLPFLLSLILVPVLHELVHGISMRIFGAHPQYGFLWKLWAFYATSPGYAYPRWQFMIIALAPLIVLSVVAVLLMALMTGTAWVAITAISATLNATGAIGDLWIIGLILRYPAYAYVVDERDGVRIFLPGEETTAV
jgi:hypothetical protein